MLSARRDGDRQRNPPGREPTGLSTDLYELTSVGRSDWGRTGARSKSRRSSASSNAAIRISNRGEAPRLTCGAAVAAPLWVAIRTFTDAGPLQ